MPFLAGQANVANTARRVSPLRHLWKVVQLLVTVTLIYWVVQKLDWHQVGTSVLTAKIGWLAVALVYPFLTIAIDALRWQVLLGAICRRVAWHKLFRVNLVGIFFDNFLPGNIGSDAYRTLSLSQQYAPREVLATVVLGRVLSWFGLLMLGMVGLLALRDQLPVDAFWSGLYVVGAMLCLTGIGFGLLTTYQRWNVYRGHKSILWRWKALALFLQSVNQLLTTRTLIVCLGLSLLLHAVVISASVVIAKAYGVLPEQLFFVACAAPLGLIAAMLPISIAGHGVRETVFIYLLSNVGIMPEVAVVISISLYVVLALASLTGGATRAFSEAKTLARGVDEGIAAQ